MWVEKTQKGNFKFVEGYKDPNTGKTKRVSVTYEKNTSATRKQALKELSDRIAKAMNKGSHTTYNEAVEVYLKSIDIKPTTLNVKTASLKRMAKFFDQGDVYIDKVTSAYIRDFYMMGDIYIPRSDMEILKIFFNWCYKNEYIKSKIFDKVTLKEQRHNPNYKKVFFEKEEMIEILEKLDQGKSYTNRMTRYIVEFITLTGLRIGELLALRHPDISDGTLSISKTFSAGIILSTPKTEKSVRDIALNPRALQIVAEVKLLKRIHGIESDIIFPSSTGGYYCIGSIKNNLKKCNIYPSRIHIFRHTHASILAEKGVPLEAIQRRLGHENDRITKEIYIHMTERMKFKENELFRNLEIL